MRIERATCGVCGTEPADWKGDHQHYIGEVYQCWGCAALELAEVPKDSRGSHKRLRLTEDWLAELQERLERGEDIPL